MPNAKMEALNKDSSTDQIQDAISAEIELCMQQGGKDSKECAGKAYGMARQATGKALDYGK